MTTRSRATNDSATDMKPKMPLPVLEQLHADIDERVRLVRDGHPDWLCRMGCSGCCHRLAEIPQLTAAEWACLRQGLIELPEEQRDQIIDEVKALNEQTSRPILCPMLNQADGLCRVYPYRPVACRTYGYYVQRDKGLYCREIEARVDAGVLDTVVWGNHDAVDRRLEQMGETRELTEWFREF